VLFLVGFKLRDDGEEEKVFDEVEEALVPME
jgi:hypothetical protein